MFSNFVIRYCSLDTPPLTVAYKLDKKVNPDIVTQAVITIPFSQLM